MIQMDIYVSCTDKNEARNLYNYLLKSPFTIVRFTLVHFLAVLFTIVHFVIQPATSPHAAASPGGLRDDMRLPDRRLAETDGQVGAGHTHRRVLAE